MESVAIIGATGYAGVELVRHICDHPHFELALATSSREQGRVLSSLYPALKKRTDVVLESYDPATIAQKASLVFLAVPHTAALAMVPDLLEQGCVVIDLSADYRLADAACYESWYGVPHTSPKLLRESVYGLPELNRERLHGARLVAMPGCYPTATALAAMPAYQAHLATKAPCVVTALSGVSGAGRSVSPVTHFCEAHESVKAYAALTHRHTPEIAQTLSLAAGLPVEVFFTPHLVPMTRGLLSTVTLSLKDDVTFADLYAVYEARYAEEPFVTLLEKGTFPATKDVVGSNHAYIGIAVDEDSHTAVISTALDNLVKGASGQAIQCANIMYGFSEVAGLEQIGMVV